MTASWNAGKVALALSALEECLPSLREFLRTTLNEYHGADHSSQYYDVLAGDWLEHFAHVVYAAWQDCLTTDGAITEAHAIPVAADNRKFLQSAVEDGKFHEYFRWAVARLLEGQSPESWRFANEEISVTGGSNRAFTTNRLACSFATSRPKLIICDPYFKCSRASWLTAMWRWRQWVRWDDVQYPIDLKCKINTSWRKTKASGIRATGLMELLQALMPLHLPVILLEGFKEFQEETRGLPIHRPRAVYTANALHGHMAFKFLAAKWQEEGTLLLDHQHGGGYGLDRVHVIENYESRVSDKFYTWGWRSADQRIQPLSPPALPDGHRRKRRQVLLNCVMFPQHFYRLHFHPMPGTIENLVLETTKFATEMADKRSLLVRPYQSDWGWGMAQAIRSAVPGVLFDETRPNAFTRYIESELVVHNYLGSSWLETLAMNIPTVCFFDPEAYAFRHQAQVYIDGLENLGILHRSGGEAAKFILSLGHDIASWWKSADIQNARSRFVGQYANFSREWDKQWEREFETLVGS